MCFTGSNMLKFTKIVHRRRKDDEIPSARTAIRNHCLECCGYSSKETGLCTASECWLYPWRLGETPPELRRKTGFALHNGGGNQPQESSNAEEGSNV